ncbi:MAG: STAS domain-containing protein [Burkholderiales bacterium]|nr:STAS domain-containing protein [Burkholderiales bacterium]
MDLTVTELEGPVTCVRLAGRLDAAGAEQIGLRFTASVVAGKTPAIVDLAEVSFVASMGLRLLISNARSLALKGRKLVLFGATELVQEVFNDAALDQIMSIVPTQAAALAEVTG